MWKRLVVAVLAAGLTTGCYFTDDLQGNGDTVTEARVTAGFVKVENHDSLDVVVMEGEVPEVKVIIDSNLQSSVHTFIVAEDTLVIATDGSFNPKGQARVEVRMPRVVGVTHRGSGTLRVEGFEQGQEDMRLVSKGSGTLSFCGGAHTLDAKHSGSGRMELCTAGERMVEWVDFTQSGSGELTWSGSAKLVRAFMEGSGDMTLTGATNRLVSRLDGSGRMSAQGLRAVDVDIASQGSGNVTAFVDGGGVVVTLDSSGSVDLFGHALSTQARVNGSGRVIWH
ncbi:hypothetical protein G4177_01595 [Corallococcus sp. ZKHCc1 1396]|uniref:Putative auto-transporter adhesin head GIN domain-containing protein n=1 Tax=Corallococcus soli TaxID=2710757 RepID=A0ABR9PG18_9BACT|nr:DUF2807 domain-containing protein [Corallococcus soli]MBE4746865.1 hypothetical protein [Corallococcus soli]